MERTSDGINSNPSGRKFQVQVRQNITASTGSETAETDHYGKVSPISSFSILNKA